MGGSVLLTGASGFVGRAVVPRLVAEGYEVHAVSRADADLLDPAAAGALVDALRPTHLVHLAWYTTPGRYWTADENLAWVGASLELLRAFAAAGGTRALVAGTCAEYEWGGEEPLSERATPLRPASLYGTCKDALRAIAEAHAAVAGYSVAWARIFHPFGPGEPPERLVPSVVRGLLAGRVVDLSPGEQRRDFLFVEDVAAALVALLASPVEGAVNVGSGRATSVRELVDAIAARAGDPELVRFGARPAADEPAVVVADTERLRGEVGWSPAIALEEGVERTIEWWRANPEG